LTVAVLLSMIFKVLIASKAAFSQYQMVIASLVLRGLF